MTLLDLFIYFYESCFMSLIYFYEFKEKLRDKFTFNPIVNCYKDN